MGSPRLLSSLPVAGKGTMGGRWALGALGAVRAECLCGEAGSPWDLLEDGLPPLP